MRMWSVAPDVLCMKHLLGEHVEMHMFAGSIRKGISMNGYIEAGLLDVREVANRHDALAVEIANRGMRHRTPLAPLSAAMLRRFAKNPGKIPEVESRKELLKRCVECRRRYAAWVRYKR